MRSVNVTGDILRSMLRPTLFLASLATYFVTSEDVVWRFIKDYPDARLFEHFSFGVAAILLGIAFFLKLQASVSMVWSPARISAANLLQAVGIGSLLPLSGFLLFILGEFGISLFQIAWQSERSEQPPIAQPAPWTSALAEHIGLCCAFASMIVFSIVLSDRLADLLFAASALISSIAGGRRVLQTWSNRS